MRAPRHDPLRLDLAAFAADGASLSGEWPGHTLARLADLQTPPQDTAPAPVTWHAQGERRAVAVGDPELWLTLQVQAPVWLTCQRCLQPMSVPLALDRRLRFVHGEAEAEALDAESEDDVLALARWMSLRELVEDELLLALPLVPRHGVCPQPLPVPVPLEAEASEMTEGGNAVVASAPIPPDDGLPGKPHPFAALAALKVGRGGGPAGGKA